MGASIANRFAKEPHNQIYITYFSSVKKAENLQAEYANLTAFRCNFLDDTEVNDFLGRMDMLGIDVLVNNAFSTKIAKKHFHKTDIQHFVGSFASNIIPTIKITQKAILQFRKKKFGKIITILSSAIINNPPIGYSEYAACKAYLASLSKSWAHENAGYNVTSNSISPAFMKTNLTADTDDRVLEELIAIHPLKQLLSPDDVAEAAFFLSTCSQQINGINLIINSATDVI